MYAEFTMHMLQMTENKKWQETDAISLAELFCAVQNLVKKWQVVSNGTRVQIDKV